MFAIKLAYRTTIYPYPMLFITFYTEYDNQEEHLLTSIILAILLPIIEKAKRKYNATEIPMEPNKTTHVLEFDDIPSAIATCCTLRFNHLDDMMQFVKQDIYPH